MILKESIWVDAPAKAIYRFFEEMEHNYLRWHPGHESFEWLAEPGIREGNIIRFVETIGGKRMSKKVSYTKVVPNHLIEFAPTAWFFRMFLPRMLFRVEPESHSCLVTQEIHLRIGPLAAWLNRRDLQAVREHMAEEAQNLKQIVEAEVNAVVSASAESGPMADRLLTESSPKSAGRR